MKLPERIFLDTSVVNFIVDYSEFIFHGINITENLNDRIYQDIMAMAHIFHYANHNAIEMIISNTTLKEVQATSDSEKRKKLINYCTELWTYFHILIQGDYHAPGIEVKYYEEYLLDKGLSAIKDDNDRCLIIESLFYKCDVFCTRDYKTILKHRSNLKKHIPLEILTPTEWYFRYQYKKIY